MSYMCSYNAINGVPACANRELLTDLLRNTWNFSGFVVSDCGKCSGCRNKGRRGREGREVGGREGEEGEMGRREREGEEAERGMGREGPGSV